MINFVDTVLGLSYGDEGKVCLVPATNNIIAV